MIGSVDLVTDKSYQKGLFGKIHVVGEDNGIKSKIIYTLFFIVISGTALLSFLFLKRAKQDKKFMFKRSDEW